MRLRVQEKGPYVRAICQLPDGRTFVRTVSAEPRALAAALAGEPELGGKFGRRLKRGLKKAVVKPIRFANKITHSGPIEKMHKAVQKTVSKYIPIAKPFIDIHNSLASATQKVIAGKKIKAKATAKAIAAATKNLPIAQKQAAQQALVIRHKQDEALKDVAAKVAKAKVVNAAARAAKANPKNKAAKKVLAAAKPSGFYMVTFPNGKTRKVPASKVG